MNLSSGLFGCYSFPFNVLALALKCSYSCSGFFHSEISWDPAFNHTWVVIQIQFQM